LEKFLDVDYVILASAFDVPNGGEVSQRVNELPPPAPSNTNPNSSVASTQDDNNDAVPDDLPTNLSGHVELARTPRKSTFIIVLNYF